jgi:DNA-binding response OmpR family regulator
MAYLQKPFSPHSLAAKVRETLGPRTPRPALPAEAFAAVSGQLSAVS